MAQLNVAVANEAVVKRVNYIWEMSQNDEYFKRRGGVSEVSRKNTKEGYYHPR